MSNKPKMNECNKGILIASIFILVCSFGSLASLAEILLLNKLSAASILCLFAYIMSSMGYIIIVGVIRTLKKYGYITDDNNSDKKIEWKDIQ